LTLRIEARTCGSIHSKSKRCEPARVGFELALGEAVTAIQLGNCDLVRCWFTRTRTAHRTPLSERMSLNRAVSRAAPLAVNLA
jgi:hypothetical protein